MKTTSKVSSQEVKNDKSHSEKKIGTWISVGFVGLVILGTYFVLFGLYMARV